MSLPPEFRYSVGSIVYDDRLGQGIVTDLETTAELGLAAVIVYFVASGRYQRYDPADYIRRGILKKVPGWGEERLLGGARRVLAGWRPWRTSAGPIVTGRSSQPIKKVGWDRLLAKIEEELRVRTEIPSVVLPESPEVLVGHLVPTPEGWLKRQSKLQEAVSVAGKIESLMEYVSISDERTRLANIYNKIVNARAKGLLPSANLDSLTISRQLVQIGFSAREAAFAAGVLKRQAGGYSDLLRALKTDQYLKYSEEVEGAIGASTGFEQGPPGARITSHERITGRAPAGAEALFKAQSLIGRRVGFQEKQIAAENAFRQVERTIAQVRGFSSLGPGEIDELILNLSLLMRADRPTKIPQFIAMLHRLKRGEPSDSVVRAFIGQTPEVLREVREELASRSGPLFAKSQYYRERIRSTSSAINRLLEPWRPFMYIPDQESGWTSELKRIASPLEERELREWTSRGGFASIRDYLLPPPTATFSRRRVARAGLEEFWNEVAGITAEEAARRDAEALARGARGHHLNLYEDIQALLERHSDRTVRLPGGGVYQVLGSGPFEAPVLGLGARMRQVGLPGVSPLIRPELLSKEHIAELSKIVFEGVREGAVGDITPIRSRIIAITRELESLAQPRNIDTELAILRETLRNLTAQSQRRGIPPAERLGLIREISRLNSRLAQLTQEVAAGPAVEQLIGRRNLLLEERERLVSQLDRLIRRGMEPINTPLWVTQYFSDDPAIQAAARRNPTLAYVLQQLSQREAVFSAAEVVVPPGPPITFVPGVLDIERPVTISRAALRQLLLGATRIEDTDRLAIVEEISQWPGIESFLRGRIMDPTRTTDPIPWLVRRALERLQYQLPRGIANEEIRDIESRLYLHLSNAIEKVDPKGAARLFHPASGAWEGAILEDEVIRTAIRDFLAERRRLRPSEIFEPLPVERTTLSAIEAQRVEEEAGTRIAGTRRALPEGVSPGIGEVGPAGEVIVSQPRVFPGAEDQVLRIAREVERGNLVPLFRWVETLPPEMAQDPDTAALLRSVGISFTPEGRINIALRVGNAPIGTFAGFSKEGLPQVRTPGGQIFVIGQEGIATTRSIRELLEARWAQNLPFTIGPYEQVEGGIYIPTVAARTYRGRALRFIGEQREEFADWTERTLTSEGIQKFREAGRQVDIIEPLESTNLYRVRTLESGMRPTRLIFQDVPEYYFPEGTPPELTRNLFRGEIPYKIRGKYTGVPPAFGAPVAEGEGIGSIRAYARDLAGRRIRRMVTLHERTSPWWTIRERTLHTWLSIYEQDPESFMKIVEGAPPADMEYLWRIGADPRYRAQLMHTREWIRGAGREHARVIEELGQRMLAGELTREESLALTREYLSGLRMPEATISRRMGPFNRYITLGFGDIRGMRLLKQRIHAGPAMRFDINRIIQRIGRATGEEEATIIANRLLPAIRRADVALPENITAATAAGLTEVLRPLAERGWQRNIEEEVRDWFAPMAAEEGLAERILRDPGATLRDIMVKSEAMQLVPGTAFTAEEAWQAAVSGDADVQRAIRNALRRGPGTRYYKELSSLVGLGGPTAEMRLPMSLRARGFGARLGDLPPRTLRWLMETPSARGRLPRAMRRPIQELLSTAEQMFTTGGFTPREALTPMAEPLGRTLGESIIQGYRNLRARPNMGAIALGAGIPAAAFLLWKSRAPDLTEETMPQDNIAPTSSGEYIESPKELTPEGQWPTPPPFEHLRVKIKARDRGRTDPEWLHQKLQDYIRSLAPSIEFNSHTNDESRPMTRDRIAQSMGSIL